MKYQVCDCDPLDYCEHRMKKDILWINTSKIWQDSQEHTAKLIEAQKIAIEKEWVRAAGKVIEEQRMAKYDQGGGCSCGLYKECNCVDVEREAYWDRQSKEFPEMKYDAPKETEQLESATRPWGIWRVLDVDQGYKVKRLEILPDAAISLQYHNHRSEHWTIVQGSGKVIVVGNIFTVEKGDSFYVPRMALHKITNTHLNETLVAIEVQMGEICSEEDIVRC
jgi:mannose-6-phosphate isomerase